MGYKPHVVTQPLARLWTSQCRSYHSPTSLVPPPMPGLVPRLLQLSCQWTTVGGTSDAFLFDHRVVHNFFPLVFNHLELITMSFLSIKEYSLLITTELCVAWIIATAPLHTTRFEQRWALRNYFRVYFVVMYLETDLALSMRPGYQPMRILLVHSTFSCKSWPLLD